MPKYISNLQKDLKIGISPFSEGKTSLKVFAGNVGLGTTLSTNRLNVVGDTLVTGVITATTFIGSLTGIAASATKLVTPRTFEITGDIVASPISFDGTGNVSLAATIQPNSVALGSDTTGDYVANITGTSNQITVTSGTGEGSTPTLSIPSQFTAPQDVTVTRDLQVNRDLNVNGNITIGGSTATLFTTELKIFDPDIVLGFRTDASNNDVSNDNTANHGGVAVASTEGTPLVQLFIAGIETNPATYKKIMWFKSGTFSGLGTDAWLSNYAVGIGSTQFPTGTRLATGAVQFTESDLAVVRNVNASGVGTITTLNTTNLVPTNINSSGVSTLTTLNTTNLVPTNLNVSGISTLTNATGTNVNFSGISTLTTLNTTNLVPTNINSSGVSTLTTLNVTNSRPTNLNVSGITTLTNSTGTNLNFTGVSTLTNATGTNLNFTGIVTASGGFNIGIQSGGLNVTTGVVTALNFIGAGNTFLYNSSTKTVNISISGGGGGGGSLSISTSVSSTAQDIGFVGGAATSIIGIASEGSRFVYLPSTGSVGIATSIPTSRLHVVGNVLVSGIITCTDINSTSDISLKTNIHPIENSLNIISNIRGVSFDWKESGKPSYGVIAQELEEVLPALVNGTDPKSVNYNGIIGILIEGMKSQQNQINELKTEIELLKNK